MDEQPNKVDWRNLLAGGFAYMDAPFAVHPLDGQRARKMVFAAKREGVSIEEIKEEAEAYLRKRDWQADDIAHQVLQVEKFVKSIKPVTRKKSAWLITWDYITEEPPALEKRLISIRDSRVSAEKIRDFVEQYYMACLYSPEEKMRYASNRHDNPHPADFIRLASGVRWQAHITCGHDPFIHAQYVRNLKLYEDEGEIALEYEKPKRPEA